jgi:VCBS repeat-containing protein
LPPDGDESIDCALEDEVTTGSIITASQPTDQGVTLHQTITAFTIKYGPGLALSATGTLGSPIALADTEGTTMTINADGTYSINAVDADALGKDEHIEFAVEYKVLMQYKDADGNVVGQFSDTSTLTFDVCGVNDAPDAVDDDYCDDSILENATLTDNVLTNDSDIDRTDGDPTVFAIKDANGIWVELGEDGTATVELASGAEVTIKSDGSFTYDTNGAWDALNNGDHEDDTFQYQVTDIHGAKDAATAMVCIDGVGVKPPDPGNNPEHFPSQAISHITLYFRAADLTTAGVDTKGAQNVNGNNAPDGWFTAKFEIVNETSSYDLDDDIDDIMDFLITQGKIGATDKSDLIGVDIKQATATVFYLVKGDGDDASDPYPADIPASPIESSEIDAGNYTWDVLA